MSALTLDCRVHVAQANVWMFASDAVEPRCVRLGQLGVVLRECARAGTQHSPIGPQRRHAWILHTGIKCRHSR